MEYESVDAGRVLGKMEEAGNKLNIVILDACRDNPFKRSFRTSENGLAQMDAPKGSIIAYATSPGSVAADGSGRNGIYTKNILRNIRRSDLSVQEVFNEAGRDVMKETGDRQIPWISSTPIPRFYLAGGSTVVIQPSPDSAGDNASTGTLKIRTSPADADVFVDTRFRGTAPQDVRGLDTGLHTIRARKKGYLSEEKKVQVRPGRTAMVRLYLSKEKQTGRLFVHPAPDDADVKIMNIGPPYHSGIELDPGQYQVRVEKNGYKPREQWEHVQAGEDLDVYIELEQKQTLSVSSALHSGDTWTGPVTGMEFVWVEGGCYQMGCGSWTDNCDNDEKPVHEVCVDGFWMGKYEVTQGEWKKIMGNNPSRFKNGDRYPVEEVSWNDCQAFIRKLNARSGHAFRLPAEAEWEYAARSRGKKEKYAGGSDVDRVAWYRNNSGLSTHEVGTKASNGLGLYDMSGNVWEWCEDVYNKNAYSRHSRNNPVITSGSSRRVHRGGSWNNNPRDVRAADRFRDSAVTAYSGLGFRLCASRVR